MIRNLNQVSFQEYGRTLPERSSRNRGKDKGIQQELAEIPPYNFEDEDERLACERLRREEDAHG